MNRLFFLACAAVIISCNSNKTKESTENKETSSAITETTTTTAPPAEEEIAKVSFKVNDSLARTAKGSHANNRDEQIGIYTETTNYLSLGLMGDVPGRPHRGWLNFSIIGFKFEPGAYVITKDNNASFTRYETENAGGAVGYEASSLDVFKGTEMSLNITKIVPDPDSFNGRDWLASGTFSAKMLIKEGNPYKRTSNEGVNITEGTFENVRIAGGPKAN
ncbi:MAG: hypothetical protein IPM85_14145 [Chitinophagaceae bacterium]|nr:hypothetical protein [Chitinophagaceae bacterium]